VWVVTFCAAAGFVQAQALSDAGHVPDKVIMLDGPHALLLDRVKYRRIDYSTGRSCMLFQVLHNGWAAAPTGSFFECCQQHSQTGGGKAASCLSATCQAKYVLIAALHCPSFGRIPAEGNIKFCCVKIHCAGKVYHLAEAGAQSEPVRPVRSDGSPDTDVLARLVVRHDDSAENVANRLALWDRQVSIHA
jgi:hypothetical protein